MRAVSWSHKRALARFTTIRHATARRRDARVSSGDRQRWRGHVTREGPSVAPRRRYTSRPQRRALGAGVEAARTQAGAHGVRAARCARRMTRKGAHVGPLLFLLAAAGLHVAAQTPCPYSLSLSAGGGAADASSAAVGWCPPYAALGTGIGVAGVAATCAGITVPPGAVLAFGTCHLPGATCAGATALAVVNATGGTLTSVDRVALVRAPLWVPARELILRATLTSR